MAIYPWSLFLMSLPSKQSPYLFTLLNRFCNNLRVFHVIKAWVSCQTSEGPDVERSGCPKVRMSEGPDVRRSGCPKVRMSEDLYNRHYTLAYCYIFMIDNGNILQPLCPSRPTPWEERLTYLLHLDKYDTFIEWSV